MRRCHYNYLEELREAQRDGTFLIFTATSTKHRHNMRSTIICIHSICCMSSIYRQTVASGSNFQACSAHHGTVCLDYPGLSMQHKQATTVSCCMLDDCLSSVGQMLAWDQCFACLGMLCLMLKASQVMYVILSCKAT